MITGVYKEVLDWVNRRCSTGHNHVIVAFYVDGSKHYAPPHQDKQAGVSGSGAKDMEMGTSFEVLSIGTPRSFAISDLDGKVRWSQPLDHGSLLHVTGETNKLYKHGVPKDPD